MTWNEIQPNIWKPNSVGDSVEGVLITRETGRGKYDSNIYAIETSSGNHMSVWGSTILDERMKYINVGDKVRIEYKGTNLNKKGQPVKVFSVFSQK